MGEKAVRKVSEAVEIAKCLVLRKERAVEELIENANSDICNMRIESIEGVTGRMPYSLPVCPCGAAGSAEEEVAIDMWMILLPDWDGEFGENGKHGEAAGSVVKEYLR